jgi:molybdate transport system regulatory protein
LNQLAFSLFLLIYCAMQKKTHPVKKKKSAPGMRGRIWIDGKEGTFLGYGRIALLERIREYGSITKAAKSMDMSYRHAWELIESMNRQASKPFVETATGGRKGGGTRLTEEGERTINLFREFYQDFHEFLRDEEKKFGNSLKAGRAK